MEVGLDYPYWQLAVNTLSAAGAVLTVYITYKISQRAKNVEDFLNRAKLCVIRNISQDFINDEGQKEIIGSLQVYNLGISQMEVEKIVIIPKIPQTDRQSPIQILDTILLLPNRPVHTADFRVIIPKNHWNGTKVDAMVYYRTIGEKSIQSRTFHLKKVGEDWPAEKINF